MRKILSLFASLLLFAQVSEASHLMAGDITYRWISGNNYEITLTVYRDCSGVPMSFPSGGIVDSLGNTVANIGGTTWQSYSAISTFLCPTYTASTTCYGGANFGVEKYIFKYNVSLTQGKYSIYIEDCCRNTAVTNIVNSGSNSERFLSTIDLKANAYNNSPYFPGESVFFLELGQNYQLNMGGTDPDGDSLAYHFTAPLDYGGAPVIFNTSFSYTNPFSSSVPITLDSLTGILNFNMNMQGINVLTVVVSEYRKGVLIGSVNRDIQIASLSPSGNHLPSLTGIGGTTNYIINACANSTVSFVINATDMDGGQIVSLDWDSTITGATFINSPGTPASANFNWTTTLADVSSIPHVFTAYALDDFCPYRGIIAANYLINVISCGDTVWPGDANSDLKVDLSDYLGIGIAYGDTGAQRPNGSLNYIGQYCPDWSYVYANTVNMKHADCNADGVVDMNDTIAIALYMGQSHSRLAGSHRESNTQNQGSVPQLIVQLSGLNLNPNTLYTVPVKLGNMVSPVTIYGISFDISFPTSLIQTSFTSFSYTPNFISGVLNRVVINQGDVNSVTAKINHKNSNGYGIIGNLTFKTTATVNGNQPFNILALVKSAQDSLGNPVNVGSGIVNATLNSSMGIENYNKINFSVFPNPVNDELNISNESGQGLAAELFNAGGETVVAFKISGNGFSLPMSAFDNGVYVLKLKDTAGNEVQRKIIVIH